MTNRKPNAQLSKVLTHYDKKAAQAGRGPLMTIGGSPEYRFVSSGSLTFDMALGGYGYPSGRVYEIFGQEASGKTTVAFMHMAEVQKQNEGFVVFIDAEKTYNKKLAQAYGVDTDSVIYVNEKSAEENMDAAEALCRTEDVRLIVIDSVSALVPSYIEESSMEQETMAQLARFMSKAMQKIVGPANTYETSFMFINQLRSTMAMYGAKTTTPGGSALPFYSSIRIEVKKTEFIKDKSGDVIGHRARIKVVKNKIDVPWREAEFNLYYNHGVDRIDEVVNLSAIVGIIEQRGAWYFCKDQQGEPMLDENGKALKFQGMPKMVAYFQEHPDMLQSIEERLMRPDVELPQGDPVDEDAEAGDIVEYDKMDEEPVEEEA